MAESLQSKVEEHLTCSVCLKQLEDPKVLPCLHSYCHGCILNLARNAKANTFNCPKCWLAVKVRKFEINANITNASDKFIKRKPLFGEPMNEVNFSLNHIVQ